MYSERQHNILRRVNSQGFLSVDEMAASYGVSTQTIRKDVNLLSEAGEVRRVRGGVDKPAIKRNLHYNRRSTLNSPAKHIIADLVCAHVKDNSAIGVSIGTTPEFVVQALMAKEKLRVFTNNLTVALLASSRPGWTVTVPGGQIRNRDHDILGAEVVEFFGKYHLDYGIFGVGGVSEQGALLDFVEDEVTCRAAIQANSRSSFLVLDSTKFARGAHVRGGEITSVDKVFCETSPPPVIETLLRHARTEIITPESDPNI